MRCPPGIYRTNGNLAYHYINCKKIKPVKSAQSRPMMESWTPKDLTAPLELTLCSIRQRGDLPIIDKNGKVKQQRLISNVNLQETLHFASVCSCHRYRGLRRSAKPTAYNIHY